MKVIIMAGGGGSRLFPMSRKAYPKQFLALEDDRSMIAHTVARYLPLVDASDIVIVTNGSYRYHVENELAECHAEAAHLVLEPVGRNTAPAISLSVAYCVEKLGADPDEPILVAAADHIIRPQEAFEACVTQAACVAEQGAFVTFGIPAKEPQTGYGYIEAGEFIPDAASPADGAAPSGEGAHAGASGAPSDGAPTGSYVVRSFREKPDLETAKKYVAAGNYYWNSGMFAFTPDTLQGEIQAYEPAIAAILANGYDAAVEHFADMPDISIDYAVAERSQRVRMVPLTCYWNDIGSWDAMYDILPKDEKGNATRGDILPLDCHDSLFIGRDRLIAGIGLDDLLVVETDDVVLIARRGESQKVKDIVNRLKKLGRKEAVEHTTVYHAWGTSQIIGRGKGYLMKKVRVQPGKSLTKQMHYHRSEHWVFLRGTARVTKGEETIMLHEGESIFIPQTVLHQIANPGRIQLEFIEIQNGIYIGEDDIERYPDK